VSDTDLFQEPSQRSGLVPETRIRIDDVETSNATIGVTLLDSGREVVVGLATADLILVRHDN
jgi:hypothetical protein